MLDDGEFAEKSIRAKHNTLALEWAQHRPVQSKRGEKESSQMLSREETEKK